MCLLKYFPTIWIISLWCWLVVDMLFGCSQACSLTQLNWNKLYQIYKNESQPCTFFWDSFTLMRRNHIFPPPPNITLYDCNSYPELYIVHKVQIKISSLRWSEKKVQIKVHAWTWTWAVILSSHKLTVLNAHQWSDVSLRSKLKFKFRHELWSELFLKLTQRPDLICELKIRSDLLYNSGPECLRGQRNPKETGTLV